MLLEDKLEDKTVEKNPQGNIIYIDTVSKKIAYIFGTTISGANPTVGKYCVLAVEEFTKYMRSRKVAQEKRS